MSFNNKPKSQKESNFSSVKDTKNKLVKTTKKSKNI